MTMQVHHILSNKSVILYDFNPTIKFSKCTMKFCAIMFTISLGMFAVPICAGTIGFKQSLNTSWFTHAVAYFMMTVVTALHLPHLVRSNKMDWSLTQELSFLNNASKVIALYILALFIFLGFMILAIYQTVLPLDYD